MRKRREERRGIPGGAVRKPRIVITIVTDQDTMEFSSVKGRDMVDGKPAAGPSKKQFEIAYKAILKLIEAE